MNEKEYFEGNWNGNDIRFNRNTRGVRLTDSECETLINGGTITKKFTSKAGKEYEMEGKLANQEFTNKEGKTVKFVGVDYSFPNKIPNEWGGHTFTEDEKILLEQGKTIHVEGLVSKTSGKTYGCDLSYEEDETGRMRITPHFGA